MTVQMDKEGMAEVRTECMNDQQSQTHNQTSYENASIWMTCAHTFKMCGSDRNGGGCPQFAP